MVIGILSSASSEEKRRSPVLLIYMTRQNTRENKSYWSQLDHLFRRKVEKGGGDKDANNSWGKRLFSADLN